MALAQAAAENSRIVIAFYKKPMSIEKELDLERGLIEIYKKKDLDIFYDPRRGMPAHCISMIFIHLAEQKKNEIAKRIFYKANKISANNALLWGLFTISAMQKNMVEKLMSNRPDVLRSRKMQMLFGTALRRINGDISRAKHSEFFYCFINKRKIDINSINRHGIDIDNKLS